MTNPELFPEQSAALASLAESSNEKLETAGAAAATHAFNLGCSASLLPGLILVVVVFLLTRSNWVAAFITLILTLLLSIGLANLAALTARSRTIQRTYERDISPEIERELKDKELSPASFTAAADRVLPQAAVLRNYLFSVDESHTPDGSQKE